MDSDIAVVRKYTSDVKAADTPAVIIINEMKLTSKLPELLKCSKLICEIATSGNIKPAKTATSIAALVSINRILKRMINKMRIQNTSRSIKTPLIPEIIEFHEVPAASSDCRL